MFVIVTRRYSPVFFALLFGLLTGSGIAIPSFADETQATTSPGQHAYRLREEIQYLLGQIDPTMPCCTLDWARLEVFYHQRGYLPVWWDILAEQRKPAARELLEVLQHSPRHGLNPADYHLGALRSLWPGQSPTDIAHLDLLLTDAFLTHARHLYSGRYQPNELDPNWHIQPEQMDVVGFLTWIVDSPDFRMQLDSLAPPHIGYRRLQKSLAHYRELAASQQWPTIAGGPLLRRGDRDLRVSDLRRRLWLEGYIERQADDEFLFDAAVDEALKQFQARHGLKRDGIVGPDTLAALNISPQQRIQQILLNMERWRWLPRNLGERYLMVNMAGFTLQAIEEEREQLHMRVIIGKPYRSTPAFIGRLSYLVVNPFWNVPKTILREDMIPQQRRNPDYLKSQHIRVLSGWQDDAHEIDPASIDWQHINPKRFPYRLRQDPGPHNSLGRLKFMLPNEHDIYLHDTPSRHLFNEMIRTFSSGCIRLEKPLELAAYLFSDEDRHWNPGQFAALIAAQETRTLVLPQPLPVYLLYWTVWVDDQGDTHFANDVYGLDQRMAGATTKQ